MNFSQDVPNIFFQLKTGQFLFAEATLEGKTVHILFKCKKEEILGQFVPYFEEAFKTSVYVK